ncbi:histidine phosphatase family protein [Sinorhizobium meliloti WSM1022]|uniref:histidine phosphatase family protein n=1 Tax=Rhizobium meliloti TaxID=382 RepID=UPI000414BD15|nr:histidine phosphatase family protein [Sinorhizobium meliloti]QKN16233.1 histidine phosphatase family protein [Sinorhizobium meliloti WSM1022]ASQ05836.1 histidine phosphatase family protein [Sinorhizobium meliloti]MDW9409711.1 histidine phosphatase family protein [Sinorhizobium meliloti]MDW9440324.1 histidine phosphatase family protein [Sinorhizobium meliloti]MDW9455086.1 histidine phosphatase family protein [Sinorhizobium meliloti]
MLIYMVRHGQTDWNAESRLQGQKDIPLNETGRQQATGNGVALSRIIGSGVADFDFVSSPLGRTRETMERLRRAMDLDPLAYRTDERLKEVSFGDWEGYTLPELKRLVPERIAERRVAKWDFIPPGPDAESYEILSWRVGAWLRSVTRPTVCVSHGGVIRALFKLLGEMDVDEAAAAAIPQDRLLKIVDGSIGWL